MALCEDYFDQPDAAKTLELERTCTRVKINPATIQSNYVQKRQCERSLTVNSCPTCGVHKTRQRRVLMGKVPQKFTPWTASITLYGEHHCGGTLITNSIVLSGDFYLIRIDSQTEKWYKKYHRVSPCRHNIFSGSLFFQLPENWLGSLARKNRSKICPVLDGNIENF